MTEHVLELLNKQDGGRKVNSAVASALEETGVYDDWEQRGVYARCPPCKDEEGGAATGLASLNTKPKNAKGTAKQRVRRRQKR